jgi:hypothetical protein
LPGFAAFALTRVLARIVFTLVQKRWPKLGKHAHAAAGAAAFGAVWFLGHKIKPLAKYHDGIVMGSFTAATLGVAQCYMPKKYSWLLADCKPSDVMALPPPTTDTTGPSTPTAGDDEYSYLEAQLEAMEGSGSRDARTAAPPRASRTPVANAMAMAGGGGNVQLDPDLMEELGEEGVDDLYSGSFATN